MNTDKKPNTGSDLCPQVCKCGSACYIGAIDHLCVNPLCRHYDEKTLIGFQREYMKRERAKANDLIDDDPFGDEPTQPKISKPITGVRWPKAGASAHGDDWTQYLNSWAKLLGIDPMPNDTDDQLRRRLLDKLHNYPNSDSRMVPVVKKIF